MICAPGAARNGERGVSVLELSILAPVMLLAVWSIIQAALFLFGQSVASNSAAYGVSQARIFTAETWPGNADKVQGYVTNYATNLGRNSVLLDPKVTITRDEDAGTVTVRVTGHAPSLTGLKMNIDREQTGRIEQFTPDCELDNTQQCQTVGG